MRWFSFSASWHYLKIQELESFLSKHEVLSLVLKEGFCMFLLTREDFCSLFDAEGRILYVVSKNGRFKRSTCIEDGFDAPTGFALSPGVFDSFLVDDSSRWRLE